LSGVILVTEPKLFFQPEARIDIGARCGYLNVSKNAFATDGVEVAPESGTSSLQTCNAYHLTSFALFTKVIWKCIKLFSL